VATGELVAKSAEGNVLQVRLNHNEAEAVFQIESVFARGTIGLSAQWTGEIEHGYRIVSVTPDPSTVEVEGPEAVIASLSGPFVLEPIDVTGQTGTFARSRRVEAPDNVETDVETAVVTVVLEPIRAEETVYRALALEQVPEGLTVLPASQLTTAIVIRGNLLDVEAAVADPTLLRPTVSLAGAQAGTSMHVPQVVPPLGVEVVSVSQVTIVLAAGP
jgi:YbbR domain-containing protein